MFDNGQAYADALIPVRASVAGIKLVPFSIGHGLHLQKQRSPIAGMWSGKTEGKVNVGDMALAVWICSQQSTVGLSTVGGFWMRCSLRRIAKRVLRHGIGRSQNELLDYIADGFSSPKMRMGEGSKVVGSPMLGMLMVSMMSHFGRNLADAMNTPVSFAIWNRSILLDEKGYAELWTPDDYDRHEMAQELASDPAKVEAMFAEMETTKV
jgi:hypothetical protein